MASEEFRVHQSGSKQIRVCVSKLAIHLLYRLGIKYQPKSSFMHLLSEE